MSAVANEEVFQAADTGAPLVLVTGMPGAGKSNYVLSNFAWGKRDVYQCNIPGCSLPEFDPEKWPELLPTMPVDATLLFDECREVFPPKSPTSDPPPHYVLNRIRHTGRRVVLIAQHPNDIDARVRRLASRHIHLVEIFGGGGAKVYEWRGRIGDVDAKSKEDAIVSQYVHDKRVFKLYKSTELHRGTAKAPFKVRMIKWVWTIAAVGLLIGGVVVYRSMSGLSHGDVVKDQMNMRNMAGRVSDGQGLRSSRDREPLSPAQYIQSYEARVPGLAYTAVRYDEVTKPKRAPFPAACVEAPHHDDERAAEYGRSAAGCRCYTQQATRLDVPETLCRQIAERGIFMDFDPDPDAPKQAQGAAPASGGAPIPATLVAGSLGPMPAAPAPSMTASAVADASQPPGRGRNLPPAPRS